MQISIFLNPFGIRHLTHINNYRSDLKSKLCNLTLTDGILCNDPTCSDSNYHKDVDSFCDYIISSIDSAVHNNIPMSKQNSSNSVKPGWPVLVKPFQDKSKVWACYLEISW